ncbi:major facilitator superfamily domain-containing protein [Sphaerosporella brunnea]|uniref:Major facilitator superfamily domain-containing protein n=1 Tax=Sphaerosporella brunnea TaxID=1250544 RepID=A0A5J5EK44_9PEZI|nr:major facilitator superfamily domain-containing protein [Sphaerosporella brunnea]
MTFEKETLELTNNAGSTSSDEESGADLKYEQELIRRVDWRLLPILGALYSIALIDRTNLSNANVAGMNKDLGLNIGNRYSIALLVFFIPYMLFELPSNLVLRRVGAAKWLGTIAFCWGVVMIGMGFVHDWRVLTVCRTIIGFFEAGLFPGCVYLVSSWYVRFEVQKRMAIFFLISVFVGGFSSILAYGLMQMDGVGGLAGWRWIFIIEGIITVLVALFSFLAIIDFPDKVLAKRNGRFLSATDVEIIKGRIERDRADSIADPITWAKVGKHLSDFKLWVFALLFMCTAVPAYAFGLFLPILLEGMGFTAGMSQLLSTPPYIFACIASFTLSYFADKQRVRGPIIVAQAVMCISGLATIAYFSTVGIRYSGVFIGMAGAVGNIPSVLSYQSNNIRTNSKRSVSSAVQVGFGAVGGIYASLVFRSVDAPRYLPGLWATIACQLAMIVIVGFMSVYFKMQNRKQKEGKHLEGHPDFTYTL